MEQNLQISPNHIHLLLAAADGDAALLYLWLMGDSSLPCPLSPARKKDAEGVLARLGLLNDNSRAPLRKEERPVYSEESLTAGLGKKEFSVLVGEAQRILGRILSTEELKSLLAIYDYLRLPQEVVSLLITYCVQRARNRGARMPSLRTIEKEAYVWADLGIDNVSAAIQYMQSMIMKQSRSGAIARLLQITDRRLTSSEEQYVAQWIDWNFPDDVIALAYEKTCLNTGSLKWAYMNSILKSWQEKGLKTLAAIREGDGVKTQKPAAKGKAPGSMERDALRKLMEKKEG